VIVNGPGGGEERSGIGLFINGNGKTQTRVNLRQEAAEVKKNRVCWNFYAQRDKGIVTRGKERKSVSKT